ncbi:hypothetical protein [uncultured Bacteroides sp.]|uniref:hypothetical protein n=1 Tax=uncultured Bacteroides sp. TaxID=162156 RepID=UPI002AA6BE03|nr:hypothetical protein [uncultured Bacteroides sp.]
MKKIVVTLIAISALCACEPVVDNKEVGSILPESELQLDVHATTTGGNEIVMINNTPKVGSYWDYVTDVSVNQKDTVLLPFLGEQVITFTGFCDGGTVTTTRTVNITTIDHAVAAEWKLFAGSGEAGKTWVWDSSATDDIVYGTAGYLADSAPGWTVISAGEVDDATDEMLFDLNGGPNYTKKSADGSIIEKGSFKFNMSKKKDQDNGEPWSIGQLQIVGATVLSGHSAYDQEDIINTFDIIELTEDKLVLAYAADGSVAWDEATFWCFKKK